MKHYEVKYETPSTSSSSGKYSRILAKDRVDAHDQAEKALDRRLNVVDVREVSVMDIPQKIADELNTLPPHGMVGFDGNGDVTGFIIGESYDKSGVVGYLRLPTRFRDAYGERWTVAQIRQLWDAMTECDGDQEAAGELVAWRELEERVRYE